MKRTIAVVLASLVAVAAMAQARTGQSISPEAARSLLVSDKTLVLIDVRTEEEFAEGHIAGALLLPYDAIDAASALKAAGDKATTVIVYCRSGRRSAIAAQSLRTLGYTKVFDLGGVIDWPYGLVKGSK